MHYCRFSSKGEVAGTLLDESPGNVGVRLGSTSSPLLFIAILDEHSSDFKEGDSWEFLYADNLILTVENNRRDC